MKKIFKSLLWFPVFAMIGTACSTEKLGAELPDAEQTELESISSTLTVTTNSSELNNGVQFGGSISLSVPATRAKGQGLQLHLIANSTADEDLYLSGTVVIDGEGVEIEDIIPLFAKDEVLNIENDTINELLDNDPDSIVITDIVVKSSKGNGENGNIIDSITVSLEGVVTVPMV